MAQLTFDITDLGQVAFVRNLLNSMAQKTPAVAPAPPATPAAPIVPPMAAPVAPVAPAAPATTATAPPAHGRDVSNPALQALVQDLVQNKGVQIPQILGILQGLGAANISSLPDDKRVQFVNQVEALVL